MAKVVDKGTSKTPLTIEFSVGELDTLAAILAKVGGSPDRSYRKYERSITSCLETAGYRYEDSPAWFKLEDRGSIWFKDGL